MSKVATVSLIGKTLVDKIKSIKAVRGMANLGLKESKELVEDLVNGSTTIVIDPTVTESQFFELSSMGNKGGIKISFLAADTPVRRQMAEDLKKIVTYATMTAQYDVVKAVVNVLDLHLSFAEDELGLLPKEDNSEETV